jgi:signal transduction histidine kinase
MRYRQIIYSFVFLLIGVCACEQQTETRVLPLAVKGVMDLSQWDFKRDGPVKLTGEFEFYWNQLLKPQDFIQNRSSLKAGYIEVPRFWNGFEYQGKAISGNGYASYHLTVLINADGSDLGLKLLEMNTSFNLFMNGQKLSSAGVVGQTAESAKPGYHPEIMEFKANKDVLDILVQVSNFSHKKGGAWKTITLGARDQLYKRNKLKLATNFFLFGSFIIVGLYHLGIYSLRRREWSALFFGLFCLIIAVRILTTGERHILLLFSEIDYEIMTRLDYLTFYLAVPAFVQYFYSLFSDRASKIICRLATGFGLIFSAVVLLFPVKIFSSTLSLYQVFTLSMLIYATVILVKASLNKEIKAIIFLAGFSILFILAVNDMLYAQNIIQAEYMVQVGLFIFIFSQAYLLSRYFSDAFNTIEIQREKLLKSEIVLQEAKDGLEKRVEERTVEISEANVELRQEILERKQAQEKMRKAKRAAEAANRSKSEFLANMSHELRTPMNHIIGFTEMVLDKHFGKLNHTQEEYLADVHSSSKHLLSLINDILDLSKVEAGKLEYKPAKVHLDQLLTNSLVMIQERAVKSGIKVSSDLDGIPELIDADERMLKQILYNLLSNAVKFTPDGGHIDLIAKCVLDGDMSHQNKKSSSKEYIQISILDSGIGLKKKNLEMIFQPFEQVENSASRRFQGTGLGLSLSKRFVELHGGKIWAESEGEGLGATFSFTLPL